MNKDKTPWGITPANVLKLVVVLLKFPLFALAYVFYFLPIKLWNWVLDHLLLVISLLTAAGFIYVMSLGFAQLAWGWIMAYFYIWVIDPLWFILITAFIGFVLWIIHKLNSFF